MKPSFLAKRNWSSRELFKAIHKSDWKNPGIDEKYKDFFMADLVSEYDSVNLYNFLYPKRKNFSPHFVQYLDFWYADERNHADGFFELNRLIFDCDEMELVNTLKTREANFEPLQDILSSEFNLLLMFAYDEYVSVKTYKKDTFYQDFGHPLFSTWIKNLIADEAIHFGNAVKILKHSHADKLHEAGTILRDIARFEGGAYANTFLFDHDGPHFSLKESEIGEVVTNEIIDILKKRTT